MSPVIGRRQFFRLGAGAVVVVGLGACDSSSTARLPTSAPQLPGTTAPGTSAPTVPGSTIPATTVAGTTGQAFGGRRLVVVQMNGGNDVLNTLPPADGRYRDLRPTLALPEQEVLALAGVNDMGFHPALAPLVPMWDAGRLAIARGIGFEVPNRSHFVSMDRWWRADQLTEPGWLGRVLDGLAGEPPPLFATALGSGAPVLSGATVQPTVITGAASFKWVDFDPSWLAAMGEGGDDLAGLARHAFQRTIAAVDSFAEITGSAATSDELPGREGGATITDGLAVAAQLLTADAGTQVVVVSASGFDTHSNQLATQAELLADLAGGVAAFTAAMEAAGLADQVLLVTTSEFGRRAAENGSGGTDHGAGGGSLIVGNGVQGGVFGEMDLGNLLDGDVRPTIAPQALFTTCLDWLGADATAVLGARDDALACLRG